MTGVPILIYANKQDLKGSLSPNEVTEKMGIKNMKNMKGREWIVQGSSGIDGKGVIEGLDWLTIILLKKK